jgi:hypothetical protein
LSVSARTCYRQEVTSSLPAVLLLLTLVVGCGGSSSETPPPLEPDPELLSGKAKPVAQEPLPASTSAPGVIPALRQAPASARPAPTGPATPTWGNAKPESEMAPAPWRTPAPKPLRAPAAPAAPAPSAPVLP